MLFSALLCRGSISLPEQSIGYVRRTRRLRCDADTSQVLSVLEQNSISFPTDEKDEIQT